jgi:hypothetical protein
MHEKARQSKVGQYRARHGGIMQGKATQDKARRGKAGQGKAGRAGQDKLN